VITLFVISMETEVLASVPSDEVAEPPPPNTPLIGGGGGGIGCGDGVLGLPDPPQAAPTMEARPNRHRPVTDHKRIIFVIGTSGL
jgi:hypothetical protein